MADALVLLHSLSALEIQCLFSLLTSCVEIFVNDLMMLKCVYGVRHILLVLLFLDACLRHFKEHIRALIKALSDLYSF